MKEINKVVCQICDKSANKLKGLSVHITKSHDTSPQEYYDKYFLKSQEDKYCAAKTCQKESKFEGLTYGYSRYCSISCCHSSDEYQKIWGESIKKTLDEHGSEIKEKRKETNIRRYGVENPSQNEIFKQKKVETSRKNFDADYYTQTKEGRENLSKLTSERMLRGDFSTKSHNKKGFFDSIKNNIKIFYRSSYELKAFEILESDENVIGYKSEPFYIGYIGLDGIKRNYIPDLLVEYKDSVKKLIEIKPKCFLIDPVVQLKINAGIEYCNKNKNNILFDVWTEENLKI